MIVYISCVDEVRYSFVSHLSESLCEKGINDVFVDSADNLSEEAQAKVERARVSVMVLPGNRKLTTASACLGKLGKIIRCQRNDDQVVVPVLYGVRKVNVEWLSELKKITGLSHFHQSRKECSDSELVEEIARDVYEKLYHIGRIGIYLKLLQIEIMVNKQPLGIRCVGIWGMPGIGKTTLAKAFFDQKSGKFDASCFIEDFDKVIHEKGLYRLLGKQFLKEKPPDGVTTTKLSMLRDKLKNKRVLVVLDDVCNPLAAESFLGGFDWFGPESLIIITSRDKQVFRLCQVDQIYEVQGLNEKESLKLISLYVFRNDKEERNLQELSMKVIKYASGHPLALNIYGRELKGKKKLSEMETALLRLKQRPPVQIFDAFKSSYEKKLSEMETALLRLKPRLPFQIFDAFKSSYDTLNDSEKNIFLDIACFFRGENVDYVMQLLEGCDFFPHVGVDALVDKGLVTISENILQMHNLIQDVGQEIINGETIYIERRRRLWEPWSIKYLLEDNEHKRTLKRAQGTEDVEGIFLDTTDISFDIKPAAFDNMLNLRLLKIYCSNPEINHVINFPKGSLQSLPNELRLLHWDNYPLQSLPQKFDPGHLVEINMPYSQLQKLWGGTKNLEMLRTIRLCHSQELVDVNDLSKAQNLEVIDLQGCTRLHSFPDTCQLLHLRVVNLSGCLEINSFPDLPPNIETLHLQGTGIIKLPIVKQNGGELVSLSEFQGLSDDLKLLERLKSLQKSSLSCQDLGKLICLDLKDCSLLRSLPNMANLEFLEVFDLSGCSELKTIQSFPRNLKKLYIAGAAVKELPQLPQSLEFMNAHGSRLRSLPNMANLELLKVLDLSGCSRLNTIQSFPRNLKELYLAGTAVRQVPQLPQSLEFMNAHGSRLRSLPNMANIAYLKVIDISGCSKLKAIKGLPRNLKELDIAGTSVRGLPQLPQSLELLNSHGCVSLTSIRLDFEKLPMHYNFSNCFDLSPQVVNNFLVKALNNFKYIPKDHQQELNRSLAFSFCAPSHAIQNSTLDLQQGSSVMARLNPSWRNTLVGFAMLVEVAFSEDFYDVNGFDISCVCRWKNKEGHSHKIERNLHCWAPGKAVPKVQKDHIFVFFDVNMRPSTADGNDPDIWADLIVFEFFPVSKETKPLYDSCTVKKCGVRVITATTRDTSLEDVLPTLSSDPMEFSSNEVEEVPRVSYDGLKEMDKALFLYIAGLFNDEDVCLVSPLIANNDLVVSSGLKVLAKRSLIRVSSNGEIVMHCLLRKMGKEILYSESMLPGSSKDLARDFENVSVASSLSRNWKYDVFSSFSGQDVRTTFLNHLHQAFRSNGILVFSDKEINRGQVISTVLEQAIRESRISIVVFSINYASSRWNLNELVEIAKIKEELDQIVIPIFYKVDPSDVRKQRGEFGRRFKQTCMNKTEDEIQKWCQTLTDVASLFGYSSQNCKEDDFLSTIVAHVKNALSQITPQRGQNTKPQKGGGGGGNPKPQKFLSRASNITEPEDQRLKQLEVKLNVECNDNETRIVGVVGMPGIGKTYLARKLFVKLKKKINHCVFIEFEREKSEEQGSEWLEKRLVESLLDIQNCTDTNALEVWKDSLINKKVTIVLDNVSEKKHIEPLLGRYGWIKKGSKIVITTRDKSLTEGLVSDLYEVPGLNERDGLELFRAQACCTLDGNFMELSRKFVDYAGGNPLALEQFGKELRGKDVVHWETRLGTLAQCSNPTIREKLRSSYDELNELQKDAFLDIAYFFRSQDESYVRSLLDSCDPESAESGHEFRDLADKFLIGVCDGRVEMHDLLFTMAKELVEATADKSRLLLSNCAELRNKEGRDKVRGIVLDMSKMDETPLKREVFVGMSSLRYLKVYNSLCPPHSETECKLNLPDGLEFPKDNAVRYLHWVKFPGTELPSDFDPNNLIDLKLPYSNIITVWSRYKVAPNLKWVDLSHSSNLNSLMGLLKAPNLLRLNLEGCTSLKELPDEMKEMTNLVFLNLRGCTSLLSLPKITMDSLKTLILSGCSKLQTFDVISERLESLYLNGTSINGLPPAIGNLHRLILLNLKDCKNLATLPDCLGELKSLQELKLSRCSELKTFPDVKAKEESLRVLLLDGTSITEMPCNIFGLSFLRRLCLSRNDNIRTLRFDMGQMFHLKWLELKYCKNLTSLPILPPNLQCLNAHGCTSLRTVASPQTLPTPTEQIHSTFIFTNCHELEQVSKNAIISYVQKKSKLMSADRYNQDFVFKSLISTCFPGCEIPAWFNHQALGSILPLELPQDWNAGRLIGIALCVVVSFNGYKDQSNSLQVKCTCEFTNVSLSPESFIVGGFSEPGDETHTFEADHIFICYTTLLNIKKHQQFPSATEVSLGFQVTNGTSEVAKCKVVKCGFSLVYEPDEVWFNNLAIFPVV